MNISVTHFIEMPDVRQEFSEKCPNRGPNVTSNLLIDSDASHPSTVGSGFDYLCSFWLDRYTDLRNGIRDFRYWSFRDEPKPIKNAFEARKRYLEEGKVSRELMKAALLFAQWDRYALQRSRISHINRGHFTEDDVQGQVREPDETRLGDFDEDDIIVLSGLFSLLTEECPLDGETSYVEPDFGRRTYILKGEGDCLIDNTLIDVKTTIDGTWKNEYWKQLVSYVLLNSINNQLIEGEYHGNYKSEYPEIEQFGIYFARYGELVTYPVSSLFKNERTFERFRAWFAERAIEENRDRVRDYEPIEELLCDPYEYERQSSLDDWGF